MLFVFGVFIARSTGARGEATALAEERARLAQMIVRRISDAGAPITVRERRGDSLSAPAEAQRRVQLEPRVLALLNVIPGYLWVLSDTMLYASVDARKLDSASVAQLNSSLNALRGAQAAGSSAQSRPVRLGQVGVFDQPGRLLRGALPVSNERARCPRPRRSHGSCRRAPPPCSPERSRTRAGACRARARGPRCSAWRGRSCRRGRGSRRTWSR